MNFNYAREKRKFDKEWERLQEEYATAGMDDNAIALMKEFDWQWFCSRRTYARHNQPLPDDGNIPKNKAVLFRRFPKLSVELEQLRTLDKCRLKRFIGTLDEDCMKRIDRALAVSVGLQNLPLCLRPEKKEEGE